MGQAFLPALLPQQDFVREPIRQSVAPQERAQRARWQPQKRGDDH
jgi:hypothetical protein